MYGNENHYPKYEVGRVGFEPTTPATSRLAQNHNYDRTIDVGKRTIDENNAVEFWKGFECFLSKTNNHRSTQDRLNYARRYAHILHQADARELLELNGEKRIHVMKSLAALSKYGGCYGRWQQIRQSSQLKWSNGDSLQAFNSIYNKEKDLDHMLSWLKYMLKASTKICKCFDIQYINRSAPFRSVYVNQLDTSELGKLS
jgi:hypothetical protein